MYYRLRTSLIFNYSVDVVLDKALKDSLNSGIANVNSISRFFMAVTFNNGVIFTCWNQGKYYAWLSRAILASQTEQNTPLMM